MVSTFIREIIINADLILLSPILFKSINHSVDIESVDDLTTSIDGSNDYVTQLLFDTLVKFVLVDVFVFIIAGDEVLRWNHREIVLDQFYRQIFYPFTIIDHQILESTSIQDTVNVFYNISIHGTKMLVPNEIGMLKKAINKFSQLMYRINLSAQFANFSYEYRFMDEQSTISNKTADNKLTPENDKSKSDNEFAQYNETEHLNFDNNLTRRLSEIIIPFLLVPELDNFVGIYHRAPRILIYGDNNRKIFNKWLGTLKQHLNFKYLPISISHIFSCYCGDSERNLTFAFNLAKSQNCFPTILVLDGIHLICRDMNGKCDMTNRLFATLILQLDQLNQPLQSEYMHAQINSAIIKCPTDCPIVKWINQCQERSFAINISNEEINKASPIAVVAFTDVSIDELCQAVTRKGRFDFLIDGL
ncbi:hypothetical protein BMR1_03g02845 [Babesia microti strain RI]|uniref:ATPase AAA-type core domain-containing protein n=1 Tax=Babesia microti (strain RI) TaxID=1133968 RepID=A0A1R4ABW2_BABMR|nr:hypothetical protein BMR1_03g02845 [Babesia microti strain RI]SJK86509.1 hypothetical protein BMR1_03g02845 [Babesia microti strain RI]|eukprot:XP_021338660.1 hypothetical protein BMR1_03g02845 [Babesia microti strain RI]